MSPSEGRPNSLTAGYFALNGYLYPPYQNKWVQNVTYDYAGRQSSLQYWDGSYNYMTESKTWNGSGQLASVSWGGIGMTYSYSATQNNGQITQAVDTVSGETIVYQYDRLKRLVSASATPTANSPSAAWAENFQYDGFGNLTAKTLNGTTTPIPVNAATNQLTNAYYDANGNMTSGAGASFTFDASNRIATASGISGGAETYEYAPDNKRIHRVIAGATPSVNEWTFYGAKGEKLGVYQLAQGTDEYGNAFAYFVPVRTSVLFGGKLVYENGPVNLDRLGTNHAQSAQFLPYGDEITSTSNDRTKFATYTRDSYTGLDYADQRYYASTYGRFSTPDPYKASGGPNDPGSWNRYSYVEGDPINSNDRQGLAANICLSIGDDYDPDGFDAGCVDLLAGGPNGNGCGNIYTFDGVLTMNCLVFVGSPVFTSAPPNTTTPPPPPPPPPPACSVELWERPVPNTSSPFDHTYLVVDATNGDFTVEGGPSGPGAVGYLLGTLAAVGSGNALTNTNPGGPYNTELGSAYTGAGACQMAQTILSAVSNYDTSGSWANYNPVAGLFGNTVGRNSNSFASTLVNQVGLTSYFGFYGSFWTPGWGLAVNGL